MHINITHLKLNLISHQYNIHHVTCSKGKSGFIVLRCLNCRFYSKLSLLFYDSHLPIVCTAISIFLVLIIEPSIPICINSLFYQKCCNLSLFIAKSNELQISIVRVFGRYPKILLRIKLQGPLMRKIYSFQGACSLLLAYI